MMVAKFSIENIDWELRKLHLGIKSIVNCLQREQRFQKRQNDTTK